MHPSWYEIPLSVERTQTRAQTNFTRIQVCFTDTGVHSIFARKSARGAFLSNFSVCTHTCYLYGITTLSNWVWCQFNFPLTIFFFQLLHFGVYWTLYQLKMKNVRSYCFWHRTKTSPIQKWPKCLYRMNVIAVSLFKKTIASVWWNNWHQFR